MEVFVCGSTWLHAAVRRVADRGPMGTCGLARDTSVTALGASPLAGGIATSAPPTDPAYLGGPETIGRSEGPNRRVLAVVLTHNAPEALRRCLAAIDTQTTRAEALLVIDNDSKPAADLGDLHTPASLLRKEINDGPAGGHAAGLRTFLESGLDLAWVMDDDCIPDPDCLAHLIARNQRLRTDRPVFPLWVDDITGDARVRPAWCGFLISADVVRQVGLPRSDLVWWAEDTEYLQARMIAGGVAPVEERSAIVHHRRARATTIKPAWKLYYETRNTIEYRFFVQKRSPRHVRYLIESLTKLGLLAARPGPEWRRRLTAYLRGLVDGVTRKSGLRTPLGDPQR